MTRTLVTALAVLVAVLTIVLPALLDREQPNQLGSGDRVPPAVAHVAAPSPSEHQFTLGPRFVELVAASKRHTGSRHRSRAAGAIPDLIRSVFSRFGPTVAEEAVSVFGCETGGTYNPQARNGQHAGLAQLSRVYQEARAVRLGFVWAQMFDATPNLTVAADLYGEQGWRPWTCRWAA